MQSQGAGRIAYSVPWAVGLGLAAAAGAQNLAPVTAERVTLPQLVIAAPGDASVRHQQVSSAYRSQRQSRGN